ncbi:MULTISPECIES: L-tyrosine/L-tryptophan isonitrile synthase family protein [unclassified Saccharopolyspora]|uniref:L-tyrosine/L-tryptophan isonitrile synthase family protein n=1 Tax=unclassified Saccharopolyspora TaxID=2646250 RepID=UPI001CD4C22A|nr:MULTISPECIES: L-tyrosine/L-tryptophan isonitrile synthase family protein [unclassified Saccharopolyspora]MCA1191783.1 isocyanide synthase family protein [Saccharopolyspora sp. 6V]MCA1227332.1 isocyanide synthase family protein [Saccharopolyspora sp. 6M]MCA1281170.1 isocyanide synthase family protein [Saccharopolyspora sp. 7B]
MTAHTPVSRPSTAALPAALVPMWTDRPAQDLWSPLPVPEADRMLHDGGYRLRLRRHGGEFRLVGDGAGDGLPLGPEPTWAELYRLLVRLRRRRRHHDPDWLRALTGTLGAALPPRTGPDDDPLPRAVREDPVLRMHCATVVPGPARRGAETGPRGGALPSPPHPQHPGGTVAVRPDALLAPGPDGAPGLLRLVIDNRFGHREHELGFFLEHFVRPPLRAFRHALEHRRTALFAADGADSAPLAFELSTELEATGRVVTSAAVAEPDEQAVRSAARALLAVLAELADGFRRIGYPLPRGESVRAGIDRVLDQELRHLDRRTARLLARTDLRAHAHSVDPDQHEVLRQVLDTVQDRTRRRRWEPERPRPTVVIDLDLCGIVPLRRTVEATRAVSGPRPGAPHGIPELADPDALPVLPTYVESTWPTFLDRTGLAEKYPAVDWRAVHAEFFRAFARPWQRLRTDEVNAGLARFTWDVRDAGGQVVFCTGRRERVREHTAAVLRDAGVPDAPLLCMPDERTRPIPELKVARLRGLGELDVVAVFDDLRDNRTALVAEFPGALAVAVEVPGLVHERVPGRPLPDGAPAIATFEVEPRPRAGGSGPGLLSHTHSLEELQIGALRSNRSAQRWAVHLGRDAALELAGHVLADADRAADRVARAARDRFRLDEPAPEPEHRERVVHALHHVLGRKQFLKGARSNYQVEHLRRDVEPFLRAGEPIDVVLLGFPIKQCLNGLKASGPLPDLAEFGGLARLREMQRAASAVHPPGLRFRILTDGRHFRPRPLSITGTYSAILREYADLAGLGEAATIEEVDAVAARRLDVDLPAERAERTARHRRLLADALRGLDISEDPLRTLDQVDRRADGVPEEVAASVLMFREMLMSVVFSVPLSVPEGVDRANWARAVYANVYDLDGGAVPPLLRQSRVEVLRRAWHTVVRYLATMRVDEELGYEELLFPNRVRLTVSAARPGRCGFTYLGGSGLLPWQGTGALDRRGRIGADFAVSLQDRGFVPVYTPLLGPRQPWFAVPAEHTRLGAGGGMRLDPEFAATARLRRK